MRKPGRLDTQGGEDVSCVCGPYLEEPELVRCFVGPNDQGLDVSDIGITAGDGKCYGKGRDVSKGMKQQEYQQMWAPDSHKSESFCRSKSSWETRSC